jgi:hypothetical protein
MALTTGDFSRSVELADQIKNEWVTTYRGGEAPGGRAVRPAAQGRVDARSRTIAASGAAREIGGAAGRACVPRDSEPAAGIRAVATVTRSQHPGSPTDGWGAGAGGASSAVSAQQVSGMRMPVNVQRTARWLEAPSANTSTGATSAARRKRVRRAILTAPD